MIDPLLSTPYMGSNSQPINFDAKLAELQQAQQLLQQQKAQAEAAMQGKQGTQTSQDTPIWDEIERIVEELSDVELQFVTSDEEYKRSQEAINSIVLREQLRMVRPIVEQSKDGLEALKNHLDTIKQLRKMAKKNADTQMLEWQDYTQNYSDMPFSEYKKMKLKKKNK